MNPNTRSLLKWAAFSAVLSIGTLAAALWLGTRTPKVGGDFTLQHRGKDWTLSENAKKLNILYFGYTKCPDVCPMSLDSTARAFRKLDEKSLKDVQVVFVSVDFKNDDSNSAATYAEQFFPSFIGLGGNETAVKKTIERFGGSFIFENVPGSYLGYTISHTDRLFFLDRGGHVVHSITQPRSENEISEALARLL